MTIRNDLTNAMAAHDLHPLHHNDLAVAVNALVAQLDTDGTLSANSDTKVASQKAVKTYTDALIGAANGVVYKGATDCSGNPNYPAADAGFLYVVSIAGKIGGASGTSVEVGDLFICLTDATSAGTQAGVGSNWDVIQTNIVGAVTGPASSTSGNVPTFNGTSGKVIQDGGTALAALAPLASPTFTGNPLAPTPSVDDNDTSIATTAYVIGQASASGDGTPAMDGTAARGASTHYARANHVHPTDTSLALLTESVTAISNSSTAVTIPDNTSATSHRYTLTGNCTFTFPTAAAGKSFLLELRQDGTGSRTATWPGTVKWPGATAPTLTATTSKSDFFSFTCLDGTNWNGFTAGLNFS